MQVHGEVWRAAAAKPPIVIAFHQAEASAAEYAPIAPRLVRAGYTVLAIDQRSGGGEFGGTNRTAAALGRAAGYDEALPDLEAALAWARLQARGAPIVAWGSSYSAALVFLLAAAHPGEVSARRRLLARRNTSPDPHAVRAAAARVEVPVYIDQAASSDEIARAAEILNAVKGKDKQQLVVAGPSTHGSSTLRPDTQSGRRRGALARRARLPGPGRAGPAVRRRRAGAG